MKRITGSHVPPGPVKRFGRNDLMRRVLMTLLLASTFASPAWSSTQSSLNGSRTLTLDVFLDERPIGSQRFSLQPVPGGTRIVSAADFEVRILGFKAFGYNHRNQEEWRGGCLDKIQSTTDSNGRRYQVDGGALNGTFTVNATGITRQITDCVGSFAYWDKSQLLSRNKLLNPQTGEHMPVEVTRQGEGVLRIGNRDLRVERYVITGKGIDITLSYSPVDGDWLGLDSRVENGRTLRYRRSSAELTDATLAQGSS